MIQTRSQLEKLSKDELIDEVLSLENFKNDINAKFSELNGCFNNFQAKYEMVISQLECNNLNNAQYNKRETLEINSVWSDITDDVLEKYLCQALSLTGISVEPDDLQVCQHMRKKDRVIIKFNFTKQKHCVLSNHKTLHNKSLDLMQLKF